MRTIVTKVEIVNVVATATLNQPMDFSKLKNFPEINYSTDVYRGMLHILSLRKCKAEYRFFELENDKRRYKK